MKRGRPSRKSAKALPVNVPSNYVAAELLAVEERDLILVLDVLDVEPPLTVWRPASHVKVLLPCTTRERMSNGLTPPVEMNEPSANSRCGKPPVAGGRGQANETGAGHEVGALDALV